MNLNFSNVFRSLRFRLTWLYALTVLVTLAGAGIFLDWRLKTTLEQSAQSYLTEKVQVLVKAVAEERDEPGELAEQMRENRGIQGNYKLWSRLLGTRNQTILSSVGMDVFKPDLPFGDFTQTDDLKRFSTWFSPPGQQFLLTALKVRGGRLQLVLDVSHQQAFMLAYRRSLAGVLAGGFVLSILFGLLIADRGLRPLGAISSTMATLTASDLHLRLESTDWPTELNAMAVTFNSMLDRLNESFQRLSRFSAELAHELRTPLHAMRTQAEVTLKKARSETEYRDVLGEIIEECSLLNRMANGLLFLAKADYSEMQIQSAEFETAKEIAKVLEYYQVLAYEKTIQLTQTGSATLTADPDLFRRAVGNLISNSVKYSASGREILVATKNENGSFIQVSVADHGPGIEVAEIPRVTERFYRVQTGRNQSSDSLGLGLSIVQSIMELHHGFLHLEPNSAGGLLAKLYFPITRVSS